MQNKVIGIHGFARSGKDTVGDYLLNKTLFRPSTGEMESDHFYKKYSFADPLKESVSMLFNIPLNDLYEGDREKVLPKWGLSVRQILQRFGTECMRNNFGYDFWINKAQEQVDSLTVDRTIIISDVRFENEAEFCRKNGVLIHIERPDIDGRVGDIGHASESGVNLNTSDYHIHNDGSLEDLYKKVDVIMREINE